MFFLNYNKECKKSALCYFLKLMLKGGDCPDFFSSLPGKNFLQVGKKNKE